MKISAASIAFACLAMPLMATAQLARPQYSTREEFRACHLEAQRLKAEQDAQRAAGRQHELRLAQHQEESRAHFATQSRLDTNDEVALQAFNQKVDELNLQVEKINRDAEQLNKVRDEFNASSTSFNKRCASMVVRQVDRDAVLKESAASNKRP